MNSYLKRVIPLLILCFFANGCATDQNFLETQTPGISEPAVKTSIIQKISFQEEENYTRILVEGSEPIPAPFYKLLSDPFRIVIDVPNISLKEIRQPVKINNGTIGEILTTQFDDKGRLEIGLTQMADYNISKEEKNLSIEIEKAKKSAVPNEEKKQEFASAKEPATAPPSPGAKKEEAPVTSAPETASKAISAIPVVSDTAKKAKAIVKFSYEDQKDKITFHIVADGKLGNYDAFKLDSPSRLVLDIWDVEGRISKKALNLESSLIKRVRTGKHPEKLRFVFEAGSKKLANYYIQQTNDTLNLSFGNVPQASEPQIAVNGTSGPVSASKVQVKKPLEFIPSDQKSRIVLALTGIPIFESHKLSKKVVAIDLKNAFVSKSFQKVLDTRAFQCGIDSIDLRNLKNGKKNTVRLLIQLRQELPIEARNEGNNLLVEVGKTNPMEAKSAPSPDVQKAEATPVAANAEPKKEEPAKGEAKTVESTEQGAKAENAEKTEASKTEQVKVEPAKTEPNPIPAPKSNEKPLAVAPKTPPQAERTAEEEKKSPEEALSEKVYSGSKLSLDFKDADIKNILRLIAEVSNFNIITGDDVTGKITMRLVDVPWDQALDVILQARGLGMSKVGNVIRIAPIDSLKKEIQAELEAKRVKDKLEDLITELIPVNYASAKEILPQVKSTLSDRGDVKFDERTNILIVKDIPRNIAGVKVLLKSLDTRTPQVMIEARIVEANLSFQRMLGVQWGFLAQTGTDEKKTHSIGGGTAGTSTLRAPAGTESVDTRNFVNFPITGGSTIEYLFTSVFGLKSLDIAISAAEEKGEVKIISSPKIATLDNKEASVEQGLRIPYLKMTTEGTVTTDFIDANLKLTVTPHVTNDGQVRMLIRAKKDAPDASISVMGVPSIDKKEAITEVMIKDGGIVAIAGIYTIEKNNQNSGVPLLSKIPILGWLFKGESKTDNRKDLMIFISPRVIKDQPA